MQDAFANRAASVISGELTREMLTGQKESAGLGVFLSGEGSTRRFEHGGRDDGFDAHMTAYLETRQGAVIMINANDNAGTIPRVMEAIADAYGWPDFPRQKPPQPIEDKEPEVTAQVKTILEDAKKGAWDRELYTAEFAAGIPPLLAEGGEVRVELNSYGALKAVELVERDNQKGMRQYRYRFTYENETVLVRCAYNAEGKVAGLSVRPE